MITVNSLGKFQITDGNVVVGDEGLRSPMLSRLLMYLLIYRDKTIPTDEIIEAIWHEDEIENPAGALKNLMYRLRKVLISYFGEQEYVITNRGSYQWNPKVAVVIDAEAFERLVAEGKKEITYEMSAVLYEQALDLYQGEFMPKLTELHWIYTLNTYYHSLYLSCVKGLASIYAYMGRYEELDRLMTEALRLESTDEDLYCFQIEARINCGKISLAMESYEKARNIMEKELGIRKSAMLGKVYEELMAARSGDAASDIEEIQDDITEEDPTGAFLCDYGIFKQIYHLEARKCARYGVAEDMVLFTVEPRPEDPKELAEFRVRQAMDGLEETIKNGLRAGDVASRYSDTQFVVLLPTCTSELALLVANRILSKLYEKNEKYKKVNIKINVEQILKGKSLVDRGGGTYENR
jgi:DNA-binding SARP family transcriptional activator